MTKRTGYSRIVSILRAFTRPLVRIRVEGLENIPAEGGAILTLNHVSVLDPVLFGVAVSNRREVRALAKDSLFHKPVIGKAMNAMGHIPVVRGGLQASESLKTAVSKLEQGELIGLYPEGTIPPTIGGLGEFKSGAARLALESSVPVIPVAVWGAQFIVPRNKGKLKGIFKALFTRPVHRIVIGEPFTVSGDPNKGEDVVEATAEIRNAVASLIPKAKGEL